jgi:hypothetical protein
MALLLRQEARLAKTKCRTRWPGSRPMSPPRTGGAIAPGGLAPTAALILVLTERSARAAGRRPGGRCRHGLLGCGLALARGERHQAHRSYAKADGETIKKDIRRVRRSATISREGRIPRRRSRAGIERTRERMTDNISAIERRPVRGAQQAKARWRKRLRTWSRASRAELGSPGPRRRRGAPVSKHVAVAAGAIVLLWLARGRRRRPAVRLRKATAGREAVVPDQQRGQLLADDCPTQAAAPPTTPFLPPPKRCCPDPGLVSGSPGHSGAPEQQPRR